MKAITSEIAAPAAGGVDGTGGFPEVAEVVVGAAPEVGVVGCVCCDWPPVVV